MQVVDLKKSKICGSAITNLNEPRRDFLGSCPVIGSRSFSDSEMSSKLFDLRKYVINTSLMPKLK